MHRTEYSMGNRLHRTNNSVLRRIGIRFLKVIVFIGIPAAFFLYYFQLINITVTGSSRYSQEQIIERLVQNRSDNNTILFYLKYKYFKDVKIPFVEKMSFELADRNSVNIRVYDKRITGCIEFMGDYF